MRAIVASWCIALLFGVFGITGAQAQEWTAYQPEGGKYKVMMPGTPQPSTEQVPIPGGRSVTMYQAAASSPNAAYVATWVDYPPDIISAATPDVHLDNAKKGTAQGHKLRDEKVLSISQNPGREYVVDRADGIVMKIRSVLVGPRLYQIIAVGRPGMEQSPDTSRFLESFMLVPN